MVCCITCLVSVVKTVDKILHVVVYKIRGFPVEKVFKYYGGSKTCVLKQTFVSYLRNGLSS